MAVPAGDIAAARGVWSKIFASPEDNGAAVLARMFSDHPETKSYFSHFGGLDEGSAQVRAHGKTVLTALNDMIQHLDSADGFNGVVAPLAKKHATQLKVDPKNFRSPLAFTGFEPATFRLSVQIPSLRATTPQWSDVPPSVHSYLATNAARTGFNPLQALH
uniref:superoxide dismutase n=1 Tax=Erpetoichthys calabaricus TaxID=27687 RepID=A0A8C4S952_ERPCA